MVEIGFYTKMILFSEQIPFNPILDLPKFIKSAHARICRKLANNCSMMLRWRTSELTLIGVQWTGQGVRVQKPVGFSAFCRRFPRPCNRPRSHWCSPRPLGHFCPFLCPRHQICNTRRILETQHLGTWVCLQNLAK